MKPGNESAEIGSPTADASGAKVLDKDRPNIPIGESLRFRLSMTIGAIVAAIFLAASLLAAWTGYADQVTASKKQFSGIASMLATNAAAVFDENDLSAVRQSLAAIRSFPSIRFVMLTDTSGRRLVELGAGAFLSVEERDFDGLSFLDLVRLDKTWVHGPVIRNGIRIGDLYLLTDLSEIRENVLRSVVDNGILAVVAGVIAVLFAFHAVARLLAPLTTLARLMRSMGNEGHFSGRVNMSGNGEIAALACAFDTMAAQIGERDAQLSDYRVTLENRVELRTRQLQAAKDESEAANRSKSDLLATVGHEIRTPLNGILIMAELLAASPISGTNRRYANVIRQSGANLLAIINDILDVSKIEAGRMELDIREVDPDALVTGVLSLLWEAARANSVELACYVGANVPDLILADSTRVSQIVTNLVGNAIKFSPGASVCVNLTATPLPGNEMTRLRFEVVDTGVGIPADRLSAVFEKFEQADRATARRFGGTGLGLSICRKLVEAMGGEIGVESEPGRGSRFWFEVAAHARANVEPAADRSSGNVSRNIMVICRRKAIRASIVRSLVDLGHRVSQRAQADPRPAQWDRLDAVICEPDQINKVIANAGGCPVIALATMGQNEDQLREINGCRGVLTLPCSRRQLRELDLGLDNAMVLRPELELPRNGRNAAPLALKSPGAKFPIRNGRYSGLAILAVDDNLVNRTVLRETLFRLGVLAEFAVSGQQALAAIRRRSYDLVFMDISMPGMDGFETTAAIRKIEKKRGLPPVPVVALTARLPGMDESPFSKAGMSGFLAKPFTIAGLTDVLEGILTKSAARRDSSLEGPIPSPTSQLPQSVRETAPLIDKKALEMLSRAGQESGNNVATRIYSLYLCSARPTISRIEELGSNGNAAELARSAHALKSMSFSCGAIAVADIAHRIEEIAKGGDGVSAATLARELRSIFEKTEEAISELTDLQKQASDRSDQPERRRDYRSNKAG